MNCTVCGEDFEECPHSLLELRGYPKPPRARDPLIYTRLRHAYFAGDLPLPGKIHALLDNDAYEEAWTVLATSALQNGPSVRREFWRSMKRAAERLTNPEDRVALCERELAKPWRCRMCEPEPAGDTQGICAGCQDAITMVLQSRSISDKLLQAFMAQALRHRDVVWNAKRLIDQADLEAGVEE